MKFTEELCFRIARRLVIKRDASLLFKNHKTKESILAGKTTETLDKLSYSEWRKSELIKQFNDHFSIEEVIGKRILDFGRGGG